MSRAAVPPRSCLIVPAANERMLARAADRGADEVVIDLEDAVPEEQKDLARGHAVAAIANHDWPCAVSVRVNAPGTPWCCEDLMVLAATGPALRSIIVPKVGGSEDLAFAEHVLSGAERSAGRTEPLGLQALIETPRGVLNVLRLNVTSSRLRALIIGYEDLAAALGRDNSANAQKDLWRPMQDAVLLAARACGVYAIDGPHVRIDDPAGLEAAALAARAVGFDGKWAIHPTQVQQLNEAFLPTDREITHAHAVLAALESARSEGLGAAMLDGAMVDEAHRAGALAVLARAQ